MGYIDKELLLKDISESVVFSVRSGVPSPELRGARKIIDRIENAPTSDVVEEDSILKFYYCESLDKYLVGRRCGTMYYAEITELGDLSYTMSRYLPWGEDTYPSEP